MNYIGTPSSLALGFSIKDLTFRDKGSIVSGLLVWNLRQILAQNIFFM